MTIPHHIGKQQPNADTPVEEYLNVVAASDLCDGYVAPKEKAMRRIAIEIEHRSGCKYSPLTADFLGKETKITDPVYISADPRIFMESTLDQITRVSTFLATHNAKLFDLCFNNTSSSGNVYGDQIVVAARYTT